MPIPMPKKPTAPSNIKGEIRRKIP